MNQDIKQRWIDALRSGGLMVAVAGHVLATWTGRPAADADRAGEDDAAQAVINALRASDYDDLIPIEFYPDVARIAAAAARAPLLAALAEVTRRHQEALAAFEAAGLRAEKAEAERDEARAKVDGGALAALFAVYDTWANRITTYDAGSDDGSSVIECGDWQLMDDACTQFEPYEAMIRALVEQVTDDGSDHA